jgi:H+-translocating NAD(P) transhydrogenase subunit alpha
MTTGALLIAVYILVLAIFVGLELINKVPPTLHTPVLSGTTAACGLALIGALYCARSGNGTLAGALGAAAIACAAFNVVGGFLLTGRLLPGSKEKESRG